MKNSIKKTLIWLCMAVLVLSMTACGSSTQVTTEAGSGSKETLPEKTTESAAEQTTTAEATTTAAVETTVESTEESAAESTEEPSTEAPAEDLTEKLMLAGVKYQHLLAVHMEQIEESPFKIIDPNGEADRPMQVVLADIHGDEIPEIIFVERGEENGIDVQLLQIYTFVGDTIEQLYEAKVDIAAGGGMVFSLFQNGEDKEPWLYVFSGENVTTRKELFRIRYERKEEFTYTWTGTRFYCVEIEEGADPAEASAKEEWLFCDDTKCEELTKDEFYGRMNPLLTDVHPLLHNYNSNDLPEDLAGKAMPAMTYDEAMEALDKWVYPEDETLEPGGMTAEPFETIQGEYYQHGGDWTTLLTVYADGSFSGEYTAHYNPGGKTHYDVGEFHGSFADAEQIDDLTWSIRVDSLFIDGETGEKWEDEDGEYERIADPAAPVEGTTLTVYLPGTDSTKIPEEFFMWIRSGADQMPVLEGTALINDTIGINTYYYMP